MHVDKLTSPANFHSNPQRPWPSISRSKIHIENIGKYIRKIDVKCTQVFIRHYILSVVFIGTTDDTNSDDVNGCQELRRSIPFTKICQGVLVYSLTFKRNTMHCILAYGIRRSVSVCVCECVWVCVRECVYTCVRACVYPSIWMPHWWTAQKWFEINLPLLHHHVGHLNANQWHIRRCS